MIAGPKDKMAGTKVSFIRRLYAGFEKQGYTKSLHMAAYVHMQSVQCTIWRGDGVGGGGGGQGTRFR